MPPNGREPRLLDPVSTTLKATAREVDSFAGRATGSGTSAVAKAAHAARQVATPHPRPATGAARPTATATVKQGAPAVTSPVRRPASSTRRVTSATRTAARSAGATAKPAARLVKLAVEPVGRVAKAASGPLGRVAEAGGPVGSVAEGRLCLPVDNLGNLTRRCTTLPSGGLSPEPGR